VEFEYDPEKSQTNKTKHGLDFDEAEQIWEDIDRLEVPARIVEGEERNLMIGRISGKIWTAVFTRRGEVIRLISVRRARKKEEDEYGGE
jgi:uncharacterized DUF497 family protein